MDTHSKGAGPPGKGGQQGKGGGEPRGKPDGTVPPSAPPRQDRPRGFYVAGEILACDLTPAEKLLLGLMATLSGESGEAYAGVDTYASRLGVNPRTVRRLLRDLEHRGFIVQDRPGGGREIAALYRLNPLLTCVGKPGQFAPLSPKGNPDKTGRKPGHSVPGNPDKTGRKPGQIAPQVVDEYDPKPGGRGDAKNPPPLTSRGTPNGNGGRQGGPDPDAALEALFGKVRRKALTAGESARFREAVAEARLAGATDAMIAAEVQEVDRETAAWDPPNMAREKARKLLASYQAVAKLPQRRSTVAQIVSDLAFARRKQAQNPRPDRADEGAALWQDQVDWADVHTDELAAAEGRPRPQPAEAVSP